MVQLTGIGSGLDVGGLVDQLVSVSQKPQQDRIARKEAETKAQISGIGELKSVVSEFKKALEDLKDPEDFRPRTATSSDEDLVGVTVTGGAPAGQIDIEVVSLAQTQKSMSAAFADAGASVGDGSLEISNGAGKSFSVTTTGVASLANLRDLINQSSDNFGVSAAILKISDTESRLMITAAGGGTENELTFNAPAGSGLAGFASGITEQVAAKNAVIKVDDITIERPNNVVKDVLNGVELDLKAETAGKRITIDVKNDDDAVKERLNKFVSAYNAVKDKVSSLAGKDGLLSGDSIARQLDVGLRDELSKSGTTADGSYVSLFSLGLEFDRDGRLSLKSSQLDKTLQSNPESLVRFFTQEDEGLSSRALSKVDAFVDSKDGIFTSRDKRLNDILDGLKDDREDLERRTEQLRNSLMKQYNAMDSLVGQLNSTGSALTQSLANLPGFANKS